MTRTWGGNLDPEMVKFDFVPTFLSCCSLEELEELKEIVCQEIQKRQNEEDLSIKIEIEETDLELREPICNEIENNAPEIQIRDCQIMLKKIPSSDRSSKSPFGNSANIENETDEMIKQIEVTEKNKEAHKEKKFKCQFCWKKFITAWKKDRHELIHTGEKPFKCQYCEKRFSQSAHKAGHERIHTLKNHSKS